MPVVAQRQVSKSPNRTRGSSGAVEASADGAGNSRCSTRTAQRQVRCRANCDVSPSSHQLKPCRKEIPALKQVPTTQKARKIVDVKVPLVQVIDEVAKVPRSTRRQVLMIQEMQEDQEPEEAQVSCKVYVDRVKDGQNDTLEPQEAGQGALLVFTSKAGRTRPKCRKTRTSVHKFKANCKAPREKRVQTKTRLKMNSLERQPMKRCQK